VRREVVNVGIAVIDRPFGFKPEHYDRGLMAATLKTFAALNCSNEARAFLSLQQMITFLEIYRQRTSIERNLYLLR
jgi:hypothetical protein